MVDHQGNYDGLPTQDRGRAHLNDSQRALYDSHDETGDVVAKHEQHPLHDFQNETSDVVANDGQRMSLLEWRWELSMLLLSGLAILALVIVLAVEDGKQYRRWGPLTLNAVNTILTTVAGSSMTAFVGSALSQNMWNAFAQRQNGRGTFVTRPARDLQVFDSASRGPMGSLILLVHRRARSVAALGALVTVLNLGFATFTQQLITTEFQLPEVGTAAAFPRCEVYDAYQLNLSTVAAVVQAGLLGDNAPTLAPGCPTGNCTYSKSIPTVGLCGGCTEVTHRLSRQDSCSWKLPACEKENELECEALGPPCTYTLPNGPRLDFQPGSFSPGGLWSFWNATNLLGIAPTGLSSPFLPGLDALVYNDDFHWYAMKLAIIGLPPSLADPFIAKIDAQGGWGSGTLPPMKAHECALWFCIKFYDINVVNGTTSANITKSYNKLAGTSSSSSNFPVFVDDIGNEVMDRPYGVLNDAVDTLSNTISTLFPPNNSWVAPQPDYSFPTKLAFGLSNTYLNLVQGLYEHSDNLQNWTQNMAQALSSNIATVSPANDTSEFDGLALQSKTCFHIRWCKYRPTTAMREVMLNTDLDWVSGPAVVYFLSTIFLIATILQTRRRVVRPWRSDALALVVAGLDDAARAQIEGDEKAATRSGAAGGRVRIGLRKRLGGGMVFASNPST
ncbi:hypothetical protein H2200_009280 [Cladophialophora chaetospira]|uniref:Uncharacterized protein n=1 Tax=Cladophialophora chaetospira TaxID=386627 RepID=A0AA38X3T1_9EURO|nr:hypothetical protein H2200_009280 [Cladophialophora chaetospira]